MLSQNMNDNYFKATHIHKKSKDVYMILCITNLSATKPSWVRTVVYKDEIGNIWSRSMHEFKDRFDEL